MAKVNGPLLSLDASGTVGKVNTYSKWNGRNYVRLRVIPQNPQTDSQAVARSAVAGSGRATSAVRSRTYPTYTVGSQFFLDTLAKTPAGLAWNSYVLKWILGMNVANFLAMNTAYNALSGTYKGVYETAAATAGMTDLSFSYGVLTSITAGEQLYLLMNFAVAVLGYTITSSGTLPVPTSGGCDAFVTYMQADA